MKINYKIGVVENSHEFDGSWNFQYVQWNDKKQEWAREDGSINGTWDEENPQKDSYPEGTIFLDADYDDLYASTSIENIVINTKGPTIIEDKTRPTSFKDFFEVNLIIESDSLIDVRNLSIKSGDTVIFSINRFFGIENNGYAEDIEVFKNNNTYELSFNLKQISSQNTEAFLEMLNENNLTFRIFDVNGNGVEYTTDHNWKFVDWDDALERLQIDFIEVSPKDMILNDHIEGQVLVSVYNPNRNLVEAGIIPTVKLNDESIGEIDWTTWDTSNYDTEGVVKFEIINIQKNGKIIVDAWIDIDNEEYHQMVYTATFAEAQLGPWIYEDAEGRKIKLMSYPSKYLADEKYTQFVKWTEIFLNTMYKSLSNGKNIGILEKVARIGHFNDIDKVEAPLLEHYSKEFAIEINPAFDEMQKFLIQKRVSVNNDDETCKAQKYLYEDLTDDELRDFLRFVYREIPEYNQYKGSYKGIKMALNMLGLCVKLVELWSKTNDGSVKDMVRSDELNDYPIREDSFEGAAAIAGYFLTSRFDVDVEETQITFEEFNEYSYNIVRLILQVKPVTRLLNKLSYIMYFYTNLNLSFWWLPFINTQDYHHFKYTWNLLDPYALKKTEWNLFNNKLQNINRLYIPYVAEDAEVTFKTNADHEWHDVSESGETTTFTTTGDIITRKAAKNTYYNLRNLAYKSKLNNNDYIYFKINCEVETKVVKYKMEPIKQKVVCQHCGGTGKSYSITNPTPTETKTGICMTCAGGRYQIIENGQRKVVDESQSTTTTEKIFDNVEFTLPLKDWSELTNSNNIITIENDQNGFWIVFNGTNNGILANKIDQPLIEAGLDKYVLYEKSEDEMTYTYKKILDFSISMNFDLVLGLNVETTHLDGTCPDKIATIF